MYAREGGDRVFMLRAGSRLFPTCSAQCTVRKGYHHIFLLPIIKIEPEHFFSFIPPFRIKSHSVVSFEDFEYSVRKILRYI